MPNYPSNLVPFLKLGQSAYTDPWRDYVRFFGLQESDIPDLIRMAVDPELDQAAEDSDLIWAPQHACRALGQLRAAGAVEPLLDYANAIAKEQNDFLLDDLQKVLGLIGSGALPGVVVRVARPDTHEWLRDTLVGALAEIGKQHPSLRGECIYALVELLERGGDDRVFNGWIVASLLELNAAEAGPALEKAFGKGSIAESIAGDWHHVAYELGLRDDPPPKPHYDHFGDLGLPPLLLANSDLDLVSSPSAKAKARAKAKRKQAKASRKRNRKRK